VKKQTDKPVSNNELKKEFDEFEKKLEKKFATKDNIFDMSETIIERVDERFNEINDKILTSADKIMKRLDDLDAENAAGTLQMRRLTVTTDNHEKRIAALEIH